MFQTASAASASVPAMRITGTAPARSSLGAQPASAFTTSSASAPARGGFTSGARGGRVHTPQGASKRPPALERLEDAVPSSVAFEVPPSPEPESPRVDLDEILTEMEVLHARLKRRDEEIEDMQRKMHVLEASGAPSHTKVEENAKIEKLTEQLRKYQSKVEAMKVAYEEVSEQNRELKATNKKLARRVKEQTAKLRKSTEPAVDKGSVVIPEEQKARYDGEVCNYHTLLMWMLNLESALPLEDNGDANTDAGAFRSLSAAGVPPTPGGVLKMAMLSKQGQYVKSWKRRFFVLRQDGQLLYYHENDAPKPRGAIDLLQVNQFTKGGEDSLPNTIGLRCDGRDWCVAFDSQKQMKEWVAVIKSMMRRKEEAKPRPR
eukprot:TRINITY_DN12644_c0_g1_i1.p1 TRINITY_DN12644_c0_g1~~TRINITY_DN12644_c0_g1_i1.p1  ORF type:complete len:423 (+),score=143.97 TRINITY_DN12644_c0_g1_i1:147-1271(+)